MKLLMALLSGVLFGFGLALSGMTDVNNVIGFLGLFGDWNPTLAFVMIGGILDFHFIPALMKGQIAIYHSWK